MSDAALYPPPQSASQLSENIGDVLASIRRLIAQDEAAAPAIAPAPARADIGPDSLSRRRGILAEAQALTRRSEAAFGRMPEVPPLTLGPAERIAPASSGGTVPEMQADEGTGPLMATAPLAAAASAVTTEAPSPEEKGGAALSDPDDAASAQPARTAAAVEATQGKAESMITPEIPTKAAGNFLPDTPQTTDESSEAPVAAAPIMDTKREEPQAMPPLHHSPLHRPLASAVLPQPSTATSAPIAPAFSEDTRIASSQQVTAAVAPATPPAIAVSGSSEAVAVNMSANPQPAAQVIAAPPSQTNAPPRPVVTPAPTPIAPIAPEIAAADDMPEEGATGAILHEVIREVVRQQLTGDGGRMTGNLRSMIMREVAEALTQGARGKH